MRIGFNKFILPCMFGFMLLLHSCAKDDDTEPGITDDRSKFSGSWLCSETVSGGPTTTFTINIELQGSEDTIYIYNFNNLGNPFYAFGVVSGNSLVIPAQNITQVDIAGSGIYSSNKITMNYTADSDTLTAICTK